MKHLLSIFILLSSVSLAEANTTNLNCNYKNHYYRNWDMNEYGMTKVDEDTQPSINFTIIENNGNYNFDTNYIADWEWTYDNEFEDYHTEGEYHFRVEVKNKYRSIKLNRFDGNLTFLTGYTDDQNKYQWKVSFVCKKAEQLF
mgnify:FL=1|jgi:hypothetical protein|tara:strand:+ start:91 stop:519 length:429 start_codon:yes stop_codon:yes gene_type:complete